MRRESAVWVMCEWIKVCVWVLQQNPNQTKKAWRPSVGPSHLSPLTSQVQPVARTTHQTSCKKKQQKKTDGCAVRIKYQKIWRKLDFLDLFNRQCAEFDTRNLLCFICIFTFYAAFYFHSITIQKETFYFWLHCIYLITLATLQIEVFAYKTYGAYEIWWLVIN